jgi:ABC-type Na+ efflux pump permease subunit
MRFVFTSAVKDLRRLRREPVTILTWLGIPTFVALILVVIFGRAEPQPHGILLLVDEDGGLGATLLTGAFSQGPLGKMIAIEKVSRDDGRRRIDKGDGSALLIVPKGFTTAFLQSKPAKLELVRNPAQRILPDIIEQTLSMLTDGAFYLQVVAGGQLRLMAGRGAGTDARNVGNIIAGLRKYLSPRVIQLQTKVIEEKIERPGGFASLMLPGMLYMAVFFIAGGLAADVWRERTSGALRRVATTPATFGSFLAGKLLAAALVLAAVGAFGLMVAHWLVDLPVANFAVAVLWVAASGAGL